MQSTAHINQHPIHPALIPFPFALLSSAAAFDVAARVRDRPSYGQTAAHLSGTGLVSALAAAVPGIIDYFGTVPRHTRARRVATLHAVCNVSALACFFAARGKRDADARLPGDGLTLELIGAGLLTVAGWLGGELVYRHGVSVQIKPADQMPKALPPTHLPAWEFDDEEWVQG